MRHCNDLTSESWLSLLDATLVDGHSREICCALPDVIRQMFECHKDKRGTCHESDASKMALDPEWQARPQRVHYRPQTNEDIAKFAGLDKGHIIGC